MSMLSLNIIFSVLYFSVFRIPAFIYLFKLNNGNTKVVFEIWLKLTMKKAVNTQAINLRQKAKHNMINLFNSFMTQVPITKNSPLICSANQWTGFYMMGTSVVKKLRTMILAWGNQPIELQVKKSNWKLLVGFYMIGTLAINGLKYLLLSTAFQVNKKKFGPKSKLFEIRKKYSTKF